MPLSLPRLDDRTWEDLVDESRQRIPAYAARWTNHNASDPGITLIELFAYFCEGFLYRVDQVGEPQKLAFLRLINGPAWRSSGNLAQDVHDTLADLSRPHRAVTAADFEFLALELNDHSGPDSSARIGRAKCLPRTNLTTAGSRSRIGDAAGHVSLIIVPKPLEAPLDALLERVRRTIEKARLIATRVHVVAPQYLGLGVRLSITADHRIAKEAVSRAVVQALSTYFDPLIGASDGKGWPFGRNVYVSEIYQLVVKVPGVIAIHRTSDPGTRLPLEELVLEMPDSSRLRRNRLGELEAVELYASELVRYIPREGEIAVTHELVRPGSRKDGAPSTS